jgi:hypothetical protein
VEHEHPEASGGTTLRATLAGDGQPGPIEGRIGRRLVLLVDPASEEGRRLLRSGLVELIGPEGNPLGCLSPEEASRVLRERLERRLTDPDADADALREGLSRLAAWSDRMGRS